MNNWLAGWLTADSNKIDETSSHNKLLLPYSFFSFFLSLPFLPFLSLLFLSLFPAETEQARYGSWTMINWPHEKLPREIYPYPYP